MKNIKIFQLDNFQFSEPKFSIYLNRRVFVMVYSKKKELAAYFTAYSKFFHFRVDPFSEERQR